MALWGSEHTDPPTLSFQRGDLGLRLPWMPCTKLWPAVSSCGDSPPHQRPQLQCSPTPSSPAEVAGPASGHCHTSLQIGLATITSSEPGGLGSF